jgi:photosynthetic reaction center cytochrome c subunit
MRLQGHRRVRVTVALYTGILLCSSTSLAQNQPLPSPEKKTSEVFKNVQVLKDVPSDQLLPGMQFITSSLGVQCEYCHAENAFDKDDKKPKQIARKMMQMMFAINSNNFEGQQKVTCYSCHRGSPKPLAIPLIGESAPHLLNEAASAEQPGATDLPKANEIVQKYVAAIGGAVAISKLQSVTESGAFHAGPRQFPVEVLKKTRTAS